MTLVLSGIIYIILMFTRFRRQSKKSTMIMEELFYSNKYLYRFFNEKDFRSFFISNAESNRVNKEINYLLRDLRSQKHKLESITETVDSAEKASDFFEQKITYIGTVSSNIAHSIGTPLAAIKLQLKQIEKDGVDISGIMQSVNLIQDNISGFSNLYKESNGNNDSSKIFEKITVICEILKLSSEKKVNFKYSIDQEIEMPQKVLDIYKIPLCCLIENAIDATKDNGRIEVTIRKTDKFIYTEIFNTDSKISVDKETLLKRGYSTKKSKGFGISMANEIIVDHFHGELDFSNIKNGVRFNFTIQL